MANWQNALNVAIVGAGTAGLILAKELAQKGVAVTVYERKAKPGYPPSASGILSIKGLNSLGIDYKKAITSTLYGARLHAGNTVFEVRSDKPIAYVVDRQMLNQICYDESINAGVKTELRKTITIQDLREMSRNSIIVGADGAVSLVAKYFNMGSVDKYILTYRAVFEKNTEEMDNMVDLFFDNSVSPGFFSWLAPESESLLEAGTGVESKKKNGNSAQAFERFAKTYAANALEHAKLKYAYASIIPIEAHRKVVDEKNWALLVGDAAGQVKASTGGGVIYGGNAAKIAAEAIEKYLKGEGSLIDYKTAFEEKYAKDMRLHKLIRHTYAMLGRRGMALLFKTFNAIGMDKFLSKYGDMDSPSLILKRLFIR